MGIDFCKHSTVVMPKEHNHDNSTSSSIVVRQQSSSSMKDNISRPRSRMGSFHSRASLKILQIRRAKTEVIDVIEEGTSEVMQFHLYDQFVQRYHVEKIIGKGTFSHVLLVKNTRTGFYFAMKIVDNIRTNCEREMTILKRVRHPNIIHLYEGHITDDKVYFVLEVANGSDLATRLQKVGHFNEDLSKRIIQMLLSGLEYLHRNGVTHRDLKLENCLFKTKEDDSIILLTDFGLAHLQANLGVREAMQTTCGTPDYISPEMLNGELYSEKVDMWALGVILYAILSGEMPFSHENRAEMYRKINKSEYSQSSQVWLSISHDATDLISKLLSVNPERRLSALATQHHSWLMHSTTVNIEKLCSS